MEQHTIYNITAGTVHMSVGKNIRDSVENLIAAETGLLRELVVAQKQRNKAMALDLASRENGIVYMAYSSAGVELYYVWIQTKYILDMNTFVSFIKELEGHVDHIQKLGGFYKIVTYIDKENKRTAFANITINETPVALAASIDICNKVGNRIYHKCRASDIDTIRNLLVISGIIKY